MIAFQRTACGPLLVTLLVLTTVAACARKRAPETDVARDTRGADTTAVTRPAEVDRADETMRERLEAARSTIAERIYFDFNRSEIKPEYRDVLQRKGDVMQQFPEIEVRIEGHCDERGTVEYNLALGERRANAAKEYLVNLGVDPDRISIISYGEERPAVDESSEWGWAKNRRDEFVITTMPEGGV